MLLQRYYIKISIPRTLLWINKKEKGRKKRLLEEGNGRGCNFLSIKFKERKTRRPRFPNAIPSGCTRFPDHFHMYKVPGHLRE